MSRFVDFEAKSVEEAIQEACSSLHKTRAELKYDIISHGSSGIFGLVGVKKALIRVTLSEPVKTDDDRTVNEAEDSPLFSEDGGFDVSALVDETFGPVTDNDEASDFSEPEINGSLDNDAVVAWARPFIEMVVNMVSPESTISITNADDKNSPCFIIKGGDSARLIGKKGQTLDALQYLIDKCVFKKFGPRARVDVDVDGYIENRKADLKTLASNLAKKAQRTGKTMVINRIGAQERRIVHLALKNNKTVRTNSVGEGELRKLLIIPKKKGRMKKQDRK